MDVSITWIEPTSVLAVLALILKMREEMHYKCTNANLLVISAQYPVVSQFSERIFFS